MAEGKFLTSDDLPFIGEGLKVFEGVATQFNNDQMVALDKRIAKEYKEYIPNKLEALKKTFEIGIERTKAKATEIYYTHRGFAEEPHHPYELSRGENVARLQKERDKFITNNPQSFNKVSPFVYGMVEEVCDPINLAISSGIGYSTGGTSLITQMATQLFADIGMQTFETKLFYDRMPTKTEYATNALMNAVPDLMGHWIGKKFYSNIEKGLAQEGDLEFKVKDIASSYEDFSLYDGAMTQALYTTNSKTRRAISEVDPTNINEYVPTDKAIESPTILSRMSDTVEDLYDTKEILLKNKKTGKIPKKETALKEILNNRSEFQSERTITITRPEEDFIKNINAGLLKLDKQSRKYAKFGEEEVSKKVKFDKFNLENATKRLVNDLKRQKLFSFNDYQNILGDDFYKVSNKLSNEAKDFSNMFVNMQNSDDVVTGNLFNAMSRDHTILTNQKLKSDLFDNKNLDKLKAELPEGIIDNEFNDIIIDKPLFDQFETGYKFYKKDHILDTKLNDYKLEYDNTTKRNLELEDRINKLVGDKEAKKLYNKTTKVKTKKLIPQEVYSAEIQKYNLKINKIKEQLKKESKKPEKKISKAKEQDKKIGGILEAEKLEKQLEEYKRTQQNKVSKQEFNKTIKSLRKKIKDLKLGREKTKAQELQTKLNILNSEKENYKNYHTTTKKDLISGEIDKIIGDTFGEKSFELKELMKERTRNKNRINRLDEKINTSKKIVSEIDVENIKNKIRTNKSLANVVDIDEAYEYLNNKLVDFELEDILHTPTNTGEVKVLFEDLFDRTFTEGEKNFIKLKGRQLTKDKVEIDKNFYQRYVRLKQVFNEQAYMAKYSGKEMFDILNKIQEEAELKTGIRSSILGLDLEDIYSRNGYDIDYKLDPLETIERDIKVSKSIISDEATERLHEDIGSYFGQYFEELDVDLYDTLLDKKRHEVMKFYSFLSNLADTRNNMYGSHNYKTFRDLENNFINRETFFNFFLQENQEFLKSDKKLMRDLFSENINDISNLLSFGTTNKNAIRNKIKTGLGKTYRKVTGDNPTLAMDKALIDVGKFVDNALDDVFGSSKDTTTGQEFMSKLGDALSVSLWFTGLEEKLGSNNFIVKLNNNKFGTINNLKTQWYNSVRAIKRKKLGGSDIPNSQFYITNAFNKMDLIGGAPKTPWEKMNTIGFHQQKSSMQQLGNISQVHATSLLYAQPKKYSKVNQNIKNILMRNGIDETNYTEFVSMSKKHIYENTYNVDTNKIQNIMMDKELAGLESMERKLYNVFMDLTDENTIEKNIKLREGMNKELSLLAGKFKGFARAMNRDLFNRMLYVETAEGLTKTRVMNAFTSPKEALNSMTALGAGLFVLPTLGTMAGMFYSVPRELLRGNGDMSQRLANVSTKFDKMFDDMYELSKAKSLKDKTVLALSVVWLNEFNILSPKNFLSSLENNNIVTEKIMSLYKIALNATDFEDPTGQSSDLAREEGVKLALSFMPYMLTRNIKAFIEADKDTLRKEWREDAETVLEKQSYLQQYQDFFRGKVQSKRELKKIGKEIVQDHILEAEAREDFLTDNTRTYDKLIESKKKRFEEAFKYSNEKIEDKDLFKADFALHARNANEVEVEEIVRAVFNIENTNDIPKLETEKEVIIKPLKELSKGKQNLFKALMDLGYAKKSDEQKFAETFSNAPLNQVSLLLSDKFSVESKDIKRIVERKVRYDTERK